MTVKLFMLNEHFGSKVTHYYNYFHLSMNTSTYYSFTNQAKKTTNKAKKTGKEKLRCVAIITFFAIIIYSGVAIIILL